jgi:dihydrofolate synthase/folylpolyglutamate synthase
VTHWLVAPLRSPRAASPDVLQSALRDAGVSARIEICASPAQAFVSARARADADDRILVFGSFYTVADVLASSSTPPT